MCSFAYSLPTYRGDLYHIIKNSVSSQEQTTRNKSDTSIVQILNTNTDQMERQTRAQESIAEDTRINSYIWRSLLVISVCVILFK
jgi:hypothetical protein